MSFEEYVRSSLDLVNDGSYLASSLSFTTYNSSTSPDKSSYLASSSVLVNDSHLALVDGNLPQIPGSEITSADFKAPLSIWRVLHLTWTLTSITAATSMNNGFLTVGLPSIASDLPLSNELLLWYVFQQSQYVSDY